MIQQIHPRDLKSKLDAGEPIVLLDVRQPNEYDYCHLDGSTHIPLHELPGRLDELNIPDNTMVVVYCHHGVRSLSGAAILQQAGLKNVASLSGGIDAWSLLIDPSIRRY